MRPDPVFRPAVDRQDCLGGLSGPQIGFEDVVGGIGDAFEERP